MFIPNDSGETNQTNVFILGSRAFRIEPEERRRTWHTIRRTVHGTLLGVRWPNPLFCACLEDTFSNVIPSRELDLDIVRSGRNDGGAVDPPLPESIIEALSPQQ